MSKLFHKMSVKYVTKNATSGMSTYAYLIQTKLFSCADSGAGSPFSNRFHRILTDLNNNCPE